MKTYTIQTKTEIFDSENNFINFSQELEDLKISKDTIFAIQSSIDVRTNRMKEIYSQIPDAVPADIITGFNLKP